MRFSIGKQRNTLRSCPVLLRTDDSDPWCLQEEVPCWMLLRVRGELLYSFLFESLRICWFFGYWRLAEAVADRRLRDLLFPRARLGADCLFCCTRSSCHTSFWLAMPNRPSRRLESQLSQKSRVWRSQMSQMYSLRVKSVEWVNISREFGGCPDLGRRP